MYAKRRRRSTAATVEKIIKSATESAASKGVTVTADGRSPMTIADRHEAYGVVGASYREAVDLALWYVQQALARGGHPKIEIHVSE